MDLLLAGAPPAEFDALLERRLDAATDDRTRRALTEEARQAAALRAELQDHREQRGQLAALFDVAVRLSAVLEVDALLQEVVTQVRRLLDVDVAYLALLEEDQSLNIRVTEGSLGPRLRGVRIPPHSGLAGRVIDTGEPVTSLDYLDDPELAHQQIMDEIAGVEGLRSITGVPLRTSGHPIGVLMIANRARRGVQPREMSLLSSLASMVAVVIDNARLFDQVSRTAAELTNRSGVVNRAAVLHERLMNAALQGGGVEQVVASLSESVGGLVTFNDTNGTLVAAADDGRPCPEPQIDDVSAIVPVAAVDVRYGTLQVKTAAGVDDTLLRLLERAALTVALIESTQRAVTEAQGRTASELLEQVLLRPADDEASLARQLLANGLDLRASHCVLVAEADPQHESRTRDWIASRAAERGGISGRVDGRVVGVVRISDDGSDPLSAPDFAFGRAGRSGPAVGADGLRQAYQEARSCLAALHALDRHNVIAGAADLGPYHFLLNESARASAARFVETILGPLMHSPRNAAELIRTAEAFLGLAGQHRATATELGIHPNTLYQRLDRIATILGDDWKEGPRALDIQLALRIRKMIG